MFFSASRRRAGSDSVRREPLAAVLGLVSDPPRGRGFEKSLLCLPDELFVLLERDVVPPQVPAGHRHGADPAERVQDEVALVGACQNEPLHEPQRLLDGVEDLAGDQLLRLVGQLLDVAPHVAGVLAAVVELRPPVPAVHDGRDSFTPETVLQLDKLRHADVVEIERAGALALDEVADDIVVVGVVDPPLGETTWLEPHDARTKGQIQTIVNEVDAVRLAEEIEGSARLELPGEVPDQVEVVLLNIRHPVPFIGRDAIGAIANHEIDAFVRHAIKEIERISVIYPVNAHFHGRVPLVQCDPPN